MPEVVHIRIADIEPWPVGAGSADLAVCLCCTATKIAIPLPQDGDPANPRNRPARAPARYDRGP
jgi:hypothetical protein